MTGFTEHEVSRDYLPTRDGPQGDFNKFLYSVDSLS